MRHSTGTESFKSRISNIIEIGNGLKIKVFGTVPPCLKCKAAEKAVREAVEELGYTGIEVVKADVLSEEAGKLGIMMSPAVVIGEKAVKVGGVPSKEEVKRAIEKIRKGS